MFWNAFKIFDEHTYVVKAAAFTLFFCFWHFPFELLVCWKEVFWRSKVALTLLPEGKLGLCFSSHPLRQRCFLTALLTILNLFLHTAKSNVCINSSFIRHQCSFSDVLTWVCNTVFNNCPFWTLSLSSRNFLISTFPFATVVLDHEAVDFINSWDAYYLFCALKNG